jgi:hypothetical protein
MRKQKLKIFQKKIKQNKMAIDPKKKRIKIKVKSKSSALEIPERNKPGKVNNPGDNILNDDQIEKWSDFAQKNQNLNFDQKWDSFSKINPQFGATKQNVRDALDTHEAYLTDMENQRIERTKGVGGGAGEKFGVKYIGRLKTGDVFLPIYKDGKLVGRYNEKMELLKKYVPQGAQQQNSLMRSYRQIPEVGDVDIEMSEFDFERGVGKFVDYDGREFAANINDLKQKAGWADVVKKAESEALRSNKARTTRVMDLMKKQVAENLKPGGPNIFNK